MTDDLQIPEFLIRRGVPRLTNEQAHALNEARRNWVKPERRIKERPSVNAYLFERPELPVVVGVRRGDGSRTHLARYDNFAAFAAAHDVVGFPISRVAHTDDETYVLTVAKPWTAHYKTPEAEAKRIDARPKAAIIGELLQRPEGCTTKDILAATGWPSVSVPAQAKAVGLVLSKEKRDGVTRYFGKLA